MRLLFAFIFISLCISVVALTYDSFSYSPTIAISTCSISNIFVSQDMRHIIVRPAFFTIGLFYYTANQNVFTYMNQITTSNTNLVGTNLNMSMIYSYSSAQNKLRIFSRSGTIISQIQQITPSATTSTKAQFSADGSRIDIGYTNVIISYVYDGTQYVLDSNTTVPVSFAQTANRVISPDGLFIVYGETIASARLRILRINAGLGLSQIVYPNVTAAGSTFDSIVMSNPISGIYDIICISKDPWPSTYYIVFDSNTNSVKLQQTIIYSSVSGEFGYGSKNVLSLNGKFLVITDMSLMIVYQKINHKFVQIYNSTVIKYAAIVSISDNGTMITAIGGRYQLLFMFVCEVSNCQKCSWSDVCAVCNTGFSLIGSVCQCSSGNVSTITGNCVSCDVTSCYHCSYDNVCDVFQSSQKDSKTTHALVSVLMVIVCAMSGVLGFIIYKLVKINTCVSGELIQKNGQIDKTKSVTDVKNDQSQDQLSLNENHNQESHQTLAQSRNQQSFSTSIQNSPQLANFGLNLSDSNIVQVRARKKKRNMDFNEPIDDNLQEISIQHTFRKEAQKQ